MTPLRSLPHSFSDLEIFWVLTWKKFFWRVQLKNAKLSGTRTADCPIESRWPNQLGYRGVHADSWFRAALIPVSAASTMHAVLYTILISQFRARILPQTKLSHASEGCRSTGAYLGIQASKPGAAKQRLKDECRDVRRNSWNWQNRRNGDEGFRKVHVWIRKRLQLPR